MTPRSRSEASADRWAAVLQLLGRLEFVGTRWVERLLFPDRSRWTAWRTLEILHTEGLVWRTPIDVWKLPGAVRGMEGTPVRQPPYVYGLTVAGRDWLAAQYAEPDPSILETFVVRDYVKPEVKPTQLAHDLLVVDWCVSVIDHARRCPLIGGIRCQLEYISAQDERGQAYQRFDALLALTFDGSLPKQQQRAGWQIPWESRTLPDDASRMTIRFACELDRGTEKLSTLMEKAMMYAQLTRSGHYDATLGGPVLPVVIAPPGRRGAQIAREWADGWPNGVGVVSSFGRAKHPRYGALWGHYYAMASRTDEPIDLLAATGLTLDTWHALTADWTPGTPEADTRADTGTAIPSTYRTD